ncbi:hypothetical protein QFZ22_009807 [Streptomyces canus]|uniref:SWIM-type domain-containing protein n=1 Tax=Streptomyces canus TaxID=58343 RepID=A0AAW8FXN3_9ACTN|nr:hypothetical protein [Streptomyces canus]
MPGGRGPPPGFITVIITAPEVPRGRERYAYAYAWLAFISIFAGAGGCGPVRERVRAAARPSSDGCARLRRRGGAAGARRVRASPRSCPYGRAGRSAGRVPVRDARRGVFKGPVSPWPGVARVKACTRARAHACTREAAARAAARPRRRRDAGGCPFAPARPAARPSAPVRTGRPDGRALRRRPMPGAEAAPDSGSGGLPERGQRVPRVTRVGRGAVSRTRGARVRARRCACPYGSARFGCHNRRVTASVTAAVTARTGRGRCPGRGVRPAARVPWPQPWLLGRRGVRRRAGRAARAAELSRARQFRLGRVGCPAGGGRSSANPVCPRCPFRTTAPGSRPAAPGARRARGEVLHRASAWRGGGSQGARVSCACEAVNSGPGESRRRGVHQSREAHAAALVSCGHAGAATRWPRDSLRRRDAYLRTSHRRAGVLLLAAGPSGHRLGTATRAWLTATRQAGWRWSGGAGWRS